MKASSAVLWTIHELTAQVERELALDYEGARSGRVRDIPDTRTIRYYTTVGLMDRPAAMRGRTALYQERHLLQLVAIKKLQAAGLSLWQVQERLVGATDSLLARLAGLKAGRKEEKTALPSGGEAEPASRAFWKRIPRLFPVRPHRRDLQSRRRRCSRKGQAEKTRTRRSGSFSRSSWPGVCCCSWLRAGRSIATS